jgi:hypothetical protein
MRTANRRTVSRGSSSATSSMTPTFDVLTTTLRNAEKRAPPHRLRISSLPHRLCMSSCLRRCLHVCISSFISSCLRLNLNLLNQIQHVFLFYVSAASLTSLSINQCFRPNAYVHAMRVLSASPRATVGFDMDESTNNRGDGSSGLENDASGQKNSKSQSKKTRNNKFNLFNRGSRGKKGSLQAENGFSKERNNSLYVTYYSSTLQQIEHDEANVKANTHNSMNNNSANPNNNSPNTNNNSANPHNSSNASKITGLLDSLKKISLTGSSVNTDRNGSTHADRYVGKMRAGVPHGHGTYRYSNGDEYVGNFVAGKREGDGKYSKFRNKRNDSK